ncbi:MAG TPA: hypothetical protein VJU81_02655 [Methylomirabilota bacterium]|nr:hypothetical protein [Methylomirabilota bacterium]
MSARCCCGSDVQHHFEHLGCIQCGAACCPACSYELESAYYCGACAEQILELPWDPSTRPSAMLAG